MFGTPPEAIKPVDKNEPVRILGVWVTESGTFKSAERIVEQEVKTICNIIAPKAVTDKQTTYIVNNVLIPRVLYRISAQILKPSFLKRMTGKYVLLCKRKARMPSTTPNSIMHHHRLYGVKRLADAQAEEQISTLFLRLNDKGLTGRISRARVMALQRKNKIAALPTKEPWNVKRYKHNFTSGVCSLMAERGIAFDLDLTGDFGVPNNAFTVEEFFKDRINKKELTHLADCRIYFVQQLLTEDGSLKSWKQMRTPRRHPRLSPEWFNKLQDLISQTNYTQTYIADWCEDKLDYIQQFHDRDEWEGSDDSYISEVEGVTEDEGIPQVIPRQRPIEAPEDRSKRKAAFIQLGLDKHVNIPTEERARKENELANTFEAQERLAKVTWEANESCRVWNKEKELKQKLRQDSRRQGPVWQ
ncbi:hypothetical protein BGZ80_007815, partial [Entomortierella chlamydospora]